MGRATQGVKLINIKDSDSIASVTKVPAMEEEEIEAIEGEVETNDENPPATGEGSADID